VSAKPTIEQIATKIDELLEEFYRRRLENLNGLPLGKLLKRKNPYLYRATGVQKASEIIEDLLRAYASSSDEGIFGNVFFEPLALFVSGGRPADAEGVDVIIENDTTYHAYAIKSGPSVFNAQSRRRQSTEFNALRNRLYKLQKHFDAVVGYGYGRKGTLSRDQKSDRAFRELAGQKFWAEITGDPDFYLTIIRLMADKPARHRASYESAFNQAVNRFLQEFTQYFCDAEGNVDWDALVRYNSGEKPPRTILLDKEPKS